MLIFKYREPNLVMNLGLCRSFRFLCKNNQMKKGIIQ